MYLCIYVYMYICIYVYMYICIYVYMYICIYAYMYICIYVYLIANFAQFPWSVHGPSIPSRGTDKIQLSKATTPDPIFFGKNRRMRRMRKNDPNTWVFRLQLSTLQGTNISPKKSLLKMIFHFPKGGIC